MSQGSPVAILYDAAGNLLVTNDGSAPAGTAGAMVAGYDGTNSRRVLTWTDGSVRQLANSQRTTLFSNGTITASGSQIITGMGMSEWYLIINIKNAPTGTTPSITFKIEAVDPIDQTTVIDATTTQTGVAHTAVGTESIQFADNITDTVKISWTVTGTTPSFTGCNVTFMGHISGNAIEGQAEDGLPLKEGPVPVAGVDSGNNVHTLKVDSNGNLIVSPPGTGVTNGFAYGEITTSATTNVAVRKTTYTEQSSNAQRSVSSSSANDTSAGTGARTIRITYYTATFTGPFTETVTMNGTTAVNTVSSTICYIEKIEVLTVGSNGSNVGIISLFVATAGGGGTIGTIAVGDNKTLWAHHYVATGLTCSVTSYTGNNNSSSNVVLLSIRSKDLSVASAPEQIISDTLQNGGGVAQTIRVFGVPLGVTGPARITLYGAPAGTPSIINRGSFDFYEQ